MENEMSDSNEMKSMLKEWKKITEQKKKLLKGMEKELKKRVIFDDINACDNVETLQNSLRQVTDQLMKYQQLLDATLRQLLDIELTKLE